MLKIISPLWIIDENYLVRLVSRQQRNTLLWISPTPTPEQYGIHMGAPFNDTAVISYPSEQEIEKENQPTLSPKSRIPDKLAVVTER